MRRAFLLCLVLLPLMTAGSGCNRFAGPRDVRKMGRADAPGYTIEEQKIRGRERYAIIEDDVSIGPKVYADRVSPTGR